MGNEIERETFILRSFPLSLSLINIHEGNRKSWQDKSNSNVNVCSLTFSTPSDHPLTLLHSFLSPLSFSFPISSSFSSLLFFQSFSFRMNQEVIESREFKRHENLFYHYFQNYSDDETLHKKCTFCGFLSIVHSKEISSMTKREGGRGIERKKERGESDLKSNLVLKVADLESWCLWKNAVQMFVNYETDHTL